MAKRPKSLELIERYRLATTFNHLQAFQVRRELVELDAGGDHLDHLLDDSVTITFHEMPALSRELLILASQWSEQDLLDPPKAARTAHSLEIRFAALRPEFEALLRRHDDIVAELISLLHDARRA
jgi:hypothetical protein